MSHTAKARITIKTTPARVWEALTNPALVKQYMFGSDVITDWKQGSPIVYRGEWEGQKYEDKGTILEIEPEHKIVMDYFSPMSGEADSPENYQRITYLVESVNDGTQLSVIQDNNKDETSAQKSQGNWQAILGTIKEMLEQ